MSIISNRRLGIFHMSARLINDDPAACRAVMARVVILKADFRVWSDDIEYVAQCDEFAEIGENESLPTYTANLRQLEDGAAEFAGWS